MHFMKLTSSKKSKVVFGIVFLLVISISSSGCEPLRKKFVRKKKENKNKQNEFIPVLEPIDYPPPSENTARRYNHHYKLWAVWYRDFLTALGEGGSEKKYRYLLGQMVVQLEEMHELISSEKKAELSKLIERTKKVLQKFNEPEMFRNYSSIKSQLKGIDQEIRNNFNFSKIEENAVSLK